MLWTLSGARIGAVLGAGSIMFVKGAASLAELLYAGAVCGLPADSADSLAGAGRLLLVLMNKAKKVVPSLWIPMRCWAY